MSILVKNLTKIYGEQKAIDSISFEVKKGEIVGFLGPNGAGKSTTMKILTCYLPQTEGLAKVCDFDTREQEQEVKRRIGYLPESNPFYKEMYVKEYLHYVAKVYQLANPMQRVAEMIGITGLTQEQNKKIHQLSKGYKQRVGIAQAIIHNPDVLILDEPTSGLDPNQLVEIRKLIKDIGNEKTVLLSTHIMQEVEAMCERVIIINRGTIVADDSTSQLKSNSNNQTIICIEFAEKVNIEELKSVKGVKKVEKEGNEYKVYSQDKTIDVRQELFNKAVASQWTIVSMKQETRDLEAVFKELTQKTNK
jgi:ABC-2 type transport system ATP-binding protein